MVFYYLKPPMSHLEAVDISQYQGPYQDYGTPIVMLKVSGGDNGVYYDSQATHNYNSAVAAGKTVGMYHFAGGKDPLVESNFFIRACSPLAENDVMALDWEVSHPDPVGWCLAFVNNVHDQTGVWPLLYVNLSTLKSHDWSPVLTNCGLWLAAWNGNPEVDVSSPHPYIMQQYQGSPLDKDAWFGSIEQFKAYGYHSPNTPAPVTPPAPAPAPVPEPPVVEPESSPVAPEPTSPTPPPPSSPGEVTPTLSLLARFLAWLSKIFYGKG